MAMISSLIDEPVSEITMDLSTHLLGNYKDDKLGILDLRVKLGDDTECNIEIQLLNQGNIIERFLFYWSRIFNQQLTPGVDYIELNRTISILITDFDIPHLKDINKYYTQWQLREKDYCQKVLTPKMDLRIMELSKLRKQHKKIYSLVEQWLLFLDNPNSAEVQKIMLENKDIKQATEELESISADRITKRLAELREKAIRDEVSFKNWAIREGKEQGFREGIEEGIEQGIEQGIEKGIEQGIEQGKIQEKQELAKKMLEKGIDVDTIIELTHLERNIIETIFSSLT